MKNIIDKIYTVISHSIIIHDKNKFFLQVKYIKSRVLKNYFAKHLKYI